MTDKTSTAKQAEGKAAFEELPEWKSHLIANLISNGIVSFGSFTLKSKRESPWFCNLGDIGTGQKLNDIGAAFAEGIGQRFAGQFDTVYGIPEKGVALGPVIASMLSKNGHDTEWFLTRKEAKNYGEASNLQKDGALKSMIIGKIPDKERILLIDDVITTGTAKYDEIAKLRRLLGEDTRFAGLIVTLDRQEVTVDGKNAMDEFRRNTGVPAYALVNAQDVITYLIGRGTNEQEVESMVKYLRVYGTREVKEWMEAKGAALPGNNPFKRLITYGPSIVVACDVDSLDQFRDIVSKTAENAMVSAYKVGAQLVIPNGLQVLSGFIHAHAKDKRIIYDHQKAGTDVPDTAKLFTSTPYNAGADSVILFPQAGPETLRRLLYQVLLDGQRVKVIVGGWMTHPAYAEAEGGYLTEDGILDMYRIAAQSGIREFVVPATKPEAIGKIMRVLKEERAEDSTFYSPGIGKQGGEIGKVREILGDRLAAIVGRDITTAANSDYAGAAEKYAELLRQK